MDRGDWTAIVKTLDRAANHLILARFGSHSPRATANLYRRAANLMMQVAERLLEVADMEEGMGTAEQMVRSVYER